MKKSVIFIFLVVAALLQVSILDYLKVFGVKPDLLLVGVFWVSIAFQQKEALALSAGAGILKDIFTPYSFGINTFLFVLFSLLIIRLGKEISIESNPVRFIVLYIVAFCNTAATRFVFFFLGNIVPLHVFLRVAFLGSLYTALTAILLFRVLRLSEKAA
jgi:rod shape-determining protein MreD